ncbi:hypothetical protein Rhe02_82760 [Rhizocola hellebori]|uniref:Uncharacterized protein n=1 Tax=Rhizocola hellebori TaxID=1392758 RepID=A0A8J3VK88_9ACTN|nr:hypothetical protein Rhe02_82760 [Rhizocola hellebori]
MSPVPSSRKNLWITWTVVVALLLCLGGTGAGATLYWLHHRSTAEAEPAPPRTGKVTLVAPEMLGARPKNSDAAMNHALEEMKQALGGNAAGGLGEHVAAGYGDTQRDQLMVVAFPVDNADVSAFQFDLMFSFIGAATDGKVSNTVEVDPGALGGIARCGDLTLQDSDATTAVCLWMDEFSLGLVFWDSTTAERAKLEFIGIREQIERKN